MESSEWGADYESIAKAKTQNIADSDERARAYSLAFIQAAKIGSKRLGISLIQNKKLTSLATQELEALSKIGPGLVRDPSLFDLNAIFPLGAHIYPINAIQDVAIVVGRLKDLDPRTIASADPLTKYHFQPNEKQAMAVLLNNYYASRHFRYQKDGLIQINETQDATLVSDFLAAVLKHNPLPI